MGRRVKSDFLVASPSLASGASRLFDFYVLYDRYNAGPTESQAGAMALFSDWLIVGQDLQSAIEDVAQIEPRQMASS
jgi:hypothetical protein